MIMAGRSKSSDDSDDADADVATAPHSKRKEESRYHHGDLRNALIQAGLEILRTAGAHKLSLREAARTAGVSQAAPYRHFANKEALLAAVAQEGYVILDELVSAGIAAHSDNPEEQLHQVALAYLKLALEHTDHFRLMFGAMSPIHPENHPDLERISRGLFRGIVQIVARCQHDRILREGDPEQLALTAWSGFHGLSSLLVNHHLAFLSSSDQKIQDVMRTLTSNLLDGLRPA